MTELVAEDVPDVVVGVLAYCVLGDMLVDVAFVRLHADWLDYVPLVPAYVARIGVNPKARVEAVRLSLWAMVRDATAGDSELFQVWGQGLVDLHRSVCHELLRLWMVEGLPLPMLKEYKAPPPAKERWRKAEQATLFPPVVGKKVRYG